MRNSSKGNVKNIQPIGLQEYLQSNRMTNKPQIYSASE